MEFYWAVISGKRFICGRQLFRNSFQKFSLENQANRMEELKSDFKSDFALSKTNVILIAW